MGRTIFCGPEDRVVINGVRYSKNELIGIINNWAYLHEMVKKNAESTDRDIYLQKQFLEDLCLLLIPNTR